MKIAYNPFVDVLYIEWRKPRNSDGRTARLPDVFKLACIDAKGWGATVDVKEALPSWEIKETRWDALLSGMTIRNYSEMAGQVDRYNFPKFLMDAVPEFKPVFRENRRDNKGAILNHPLFGDLWQFTSDAHERGDLDVVRRVIGFINQAAESEDMEEYVNASFMWYLLDTPLDEFIRPLLNKAARRIYGDNVNFNKGYYPSPVSVPLKMIKSGQIRVSGRRVSLELVIALFKQGYSPEKIVADIDVLPLRDVYAVIAYYLSNQEKVDTYIEKVMEDGEKGRKFWESRQSPLTRKMLEDRLKKKKDRDDEPPTDNTHTGAP